MKLFFVFLTASFFLWVDSMIALGQPQVPTGRSIELSEVLTILESLGGFLMIVAGILAGIVIIASGIFYLIAGSDATKVKSARDMLKAGIIGSFIIFGVGLIISVIRLIAEDPLSFFR